MHRRPPPDDQNDANEDVPYRARPFTKGDWMKRLGEVEVYEGDIQNLLLNHFTVNGQAAATEAFCKETDCKPPMPLESIGLRSKIREAVMHGDIEHAMQCLNQIDPKILESNPQLSFRLKQQQLLHLIRKGDTEGAIQFAQHNLAPSVKAHQELLPELEKSMSLLFFSDLTCKTAQRLAESVGQCEDTARRVDDAILDFYHIEKESSLEMLLKNLHWTQRRVCESSAHYIDAAAKKTVSAEVVSLAPDLLVDPSLCPLLVDVAAGIVTNVTVPESCVARKRHGRTSSHQTHAEAAADVAPSTARHTAPSSSSTSYTSSAASPLYSPGRSPMREFPRSSSTSTVSPEASSSSSSSPRAESSSGTRGSLPQGLILIRGESSTRATTTSASASAMVTEEEAGAPPPPQEPEDNE